MAEVRKTEKMRRRDARPENRPARYRLFLARCRRYTAARRAARVLFPLSLALPAAVLAVVVSIGGFPGDYAVLFVALGLALLLAGGTAFSAFFLPRLLPAAGKGTTVASFLLDYARFLARRECDRFLAEVPAAAADEVFSRFAVSLTAGYVPETEEYRLLESGPAEAAEFSVICRVRTILSRMSSDSCKEDFAFVRQTEKKISAWYRRESGLYLPREREEIQMNGARLIALLCLSGNLAELCQTDEETAVRPPENENAAKSGAEHRMPEEGAADALIRYITRHHPDGFSAIAAADADSVFPGAQRPKKSEKAKKEGSCARKRAKKEKQTADAPQETAAGETRFLPTRQTTQRYLELIRRLETLTAFENFLRLDRKGIDECRRLLAEYRALRSAFFFADLPVFAVEKTEARLAESDRDMSVCWKCGRPYNARHKTVCARCGHFICARCGSCYCQKYIVRSRNDPYEDHAARNNPGSDSAAPTGKDRFSS